MNKRIDLKGRNILSEINIGKGNIGLLTEALKPYKKVHLITDTNVYRLHFERVRALIEQELSVSVFEAGEASKRLSTVEKIYEDMAEARITRTDCVVALGGGVVGDVAGFCGASFLRGIDVIQVPTTLLAQVDSSVGGKCGVDLPQGKNMVGAFHQPIKVIVDVDFLETLDERVFSDGMGEVIKYGCIRQPMLLQMLEDSAPIEDIVYECVKIKRDVVEQDEMDTGERMILNFGHTMGHAIEKAGNYQEYMHGEAVAAGMIYAVKLGGRMGVTKDSDAIVERLGKLYEKYKLPMVIDKYNENELLENMKFDKKILDSKLNFILIEELGKTVIGGKHGFDFWKAVKN